MKKILYILIIAVSFLVANSYVSAQCSNSKGSSAQVNCKSETAEIAVVKFHSDFCKGCKNLEPKINELKGKFDNRVVFVKFDFTNDDTKKETKNLAEEQGLNVVLESNSGTGYMVLYDLKSKKILARLDNSSSVADMEKTINRYL